MRPVLSSLVLACCFLAAVSPAGAATSPRVVEIGLFVVDITNLDERAETYTAEFDVIARWQDPAMAFEPAPGEEIPRLYVGAEALEMMDRSWNAQLMAVNVINASDPGRPRLLVLPDGTVTYRTHVRRTLRAQLDFRRFPFDRQVLPVHLESLIHDTDEVALEVETSFTGFDKSFEMAEWTVTDLTTTNAVRERVQEKQSYDRLTFLVHLDRQTGYYVWKIMLPMIVIVMLSWIVFWMSTEMLGRRAGISSTGMLTVIAYQFIVAGSLPRFPYLTVMDRFTLVSLLAIAATMLVNLMGSRLGDAPRLSLDRICRFVFPAGYVVIVLVVLAGALGDG